MELSWALSRTKGDRDALPKHNLIYLSSESLWQGGCSAQLSKQKAYSEDASKLGALGIAVIDVTAV